MKKICYLAAAAALLTACSDSFEETVEMPSDSNNTTMAYVLCEGTQGYNIDGALTTIDLIDKTSLADAFKAVNNRSLGDTPNCGIVYGDHIFIGVYGSNLIEVLDRKTLRSIKQISLSGRQGQQPRSMAAKNGHIYVSMYNGYVCRMDTVAFEFNGILPVGPNPEIIAIQGDFLYVPNSDGMNWQEGYGTTATRIDLSTFTVERNFEVPLNPYKFIAGDGVDMYLICRGDYGETPAKLYKFNPFTLESTPLVNASYADYYDGKLYAIDAPWDKAATYSIVDASTGDVTPMPEEIKVDSPTNIAICPFNGNVFITSCKLSNGYADYSQPGYCSTFSLDGKLLGSYETGVNPSNIFF